MRLKTLRDDPNVDRGALKYPDFLLQVVQGTVPRKQDGHERIELPKLIKLMK